MRGIAAFFLLFSTLVLFAGTHNPLLERAQKNYAKGDATSIFRAYNDYKNLYLQAVINDDTKLLQAALKGIVKTGKKLHIDVKSYEKELRLIGNSQKKSGKKKKPLRKKIANTKKIHIYKTNKLRQVFWRNSRLVLRFAKPLSKKSVNYFKRYDAKRNRYRYVFEIEASMMSKTQNLVKEGIESIKLVQYKQNRLRLVIQNDVVVKVRFKIAKNELVIYAQALKNGSSKTIHGVKKVQNTHRKRSVTSEITPKVIVIDPGHGGKDPGAVGYRKYKEKDVVLATALYLRTYLKAFGYKVYMTRWSDRFIKLRDRTKYANRKKADLFISIHANASNNKKVRGIETYFLSPSRSSRAEKVAAMENKVDMSEMSYYAKKSFLMFMNNHKIVASNKLAIDIQRSVLARLRKHYKGIADGGVREGPFWVLVGAQMPAVLIEIGFITNVSEAKRLKNKRYIQRLAKGIAEGINRYFIKNR